ncbi:MAG: SRPBCC family protein [Actinomycetota bacterium]
MNNITIQRTVAASPANVWAVLADYPNIDSWNTGVERSYSIGDTTSGVGAIRQCELTPGATLRETIAEWNDGERMVIDVDEITKLPVKHATMTFTLAEAAGAGTAFTMRYDYQPKGGPLSFLVAAMLGRPMNKGFNGFVDDLEAAARSRTTA